MAYNTILQNRTTVEEAMRRTGTRTPKQALDATKKTATKGQRYSYMPHTGAKQRAKAERRRIKALKKSVGL